MKYKFLERKAFADAAFEAYGRNLGELFGSAGEALFSVMVDLKTVKGKKKEVINLSAGNVEDLLFDFLSELVYLKDFWGVLFCRFEVEVKPLSVARYSLSAEIWGEGIDPDTQELKVDVKGVTMHDLGVEKTKEGYRARVVLDI